MLSIYESQYIQLLRTFVGIIIPPILNLTMVATLKLIFDTLNIYYLPQYLPIFRVLEGRGHDVQFVAYRDKNDEEQCNRLFEAEGIAPYWVQDPPEAARYYAEQKADWIIFGNTFYHLDLVHPVSKTAQLGHGIGPKPGYYHKSKTPMSVRFIEGELRVRKAKELYPNDTFAQVGFSKMDPIFNGEESGLDLEALGLDPAKPTILYAPTFNPSSLGRFPDSWPKDFSEYNILIKPHSITQTRSRYRAQQRKLKKWGEYSNTYVASLDDISLLPFMKHADILLSEASSTLFEFVAMDRPVIVCNFFKLKWTYWGPFYYRFKRRFLTHNVVYQDIGRHVSSYKALKEAIPQQLANRSEYHDRRVQYTKDHVGPTDGKSSERIVDYLERNLK